MGRAPHPYHNIPEDGVRQISDHWGLVQMKGEGTLPKWFSEPCIQRATVRTGVLQLRYPTVESVTVSLVIAVVATRSSYV